MSAPNLKEIEWAISELEQEESSFSNYIKLAALHTVRDKMFKPQQTQEIAEYSPTSTRVIARLGDSDFLSAISGKDMESVLAIIDELMDTLKTVNERAYNNVMQKIRAL